MAVTLVIGGTGNVGQALVPGLLESGQSVRAMTREPDGEVAQRLAEAGAEVVRGDLDDAASLDAALAGVDKVALITTPSPHQLDHAGAAIEAMKRSAPDAHVVRMSARSPEPTDGTELGRHHAEID